MHGSAYAVPFAEVTKVFKWEPQSPPPSEGEGPPRHDLRLVSPISLGRRSSVYVTPMASS
eukprot:765138-Hanusia_phi.AAC.3